MINQSIRIMSMWKMINRIAKSLCIVCFIYIIIPKQPNTAFFKFILDYNQKANQSLVTILLWHDLGSYITKKFQFDQLDERCDFSNCIITRNRSKLAQADVVVFFFRKLNWNNIPAQRSAAQIYILFENETPDRLKSWEKNLNTDVARDYFNWTMGYRTDSQVQLPVFRFIKKESKNEDEFELLMTNLTKIVQNKTKMAAQFVSQCHQPSQREKYTEALQNYIEVHVFGKCGPKKCGGSIGAKNHKPRSFEHCNLLLTTDYKFYLAFENSICRDYITEKFIRPIRYYSIPIVLRDSDYIATGAPPNSYIAADKFKSVEELSKHLQYLDSNDTAYMEYFHWHRDYYVDEGPLANNMLCEVCKIYNEWVEGGSMSIMYHDIHQWFFNQHTACHQGYAGELVKKGT